MEMKAVLSDSNKNKMEKLDLVKDRNFGDNISMTFEFIKQNAHKWQKVILILLALALADALCALIPSTSTFISNIFTLVSSSLAMAYAACYLNLYTESPDGELEGKSVMNMTRQHIGLMFGGSLLLGIFVVIGLILLVIPGIYLWIAASFFGFCMVTYNLSPTKSISKSYDLVNGHWWVTCGYVSLITVIVIVVALVFIILDEFLAEMGDIIAFVSIFINSAAAFILGLFYNFALGIYFYNLVDKKENINITQSIDSIGSN